MIYIKYFFQILKHKYYVMVECLKMGLFWRGIMHDLSKFLPSEFFGYAERYYKKQNVNIEQHHLSACKHQKRNKHHYQYWIIIRNSGEIKPLEMPIKYVKEMICDWNGAILSKKTSVTIKEYYKQAGSGMILHEKTRREIERLIV